MVSRRTQTMCCVCFEYTRNGCAVIIHTYSIAACHQSSNGNKMIQATSLLSVWLRNQTNIFHTVLLLLISKTMRFFHPQQKILDWNSLWVRTMLSLWLNLSVCICCERTPSSMHFSRNAYAYAFTLFNWKYFELGFKLLLIAILALHWNDFQFLKKMHSVRNILCIKCCIVIIAHILHSLTVLI